MLRIRGSKAPLLFFCGRVGWGLTICLGLGLGCRESSCTRTREIRRALDVVEGTTGRARTIRTCGHGQARLCYCGRNFREGGHGASGRSWVR